VISFVIPAHNEARLIGRTIEALHAAARACDCAYEIIVVDDDSTDTTADVAARSGARVVHVTARQIAVVRNAGARAACGDRFVFVDADTMVPVSVLRAVAEAFDRGAVGGGAPARFDGLVPLWGRLAVWMWLALQRLFRVASGCLLFTTREAFEACGGFDQMRFVGEDVELSWRLHRQGRFVIVGEPVVTSGRMVRAYGAVEALGLFASLLRPGADRRRSGHWYRERREDPGAIDSPRQG
jgi:cellulose synthase/poly-beta-1,6-N-acetylglucosamine synthase-like glycosyltransferase